MKKHIVFLLTFIFLVSNMMSVNVLADGGYIITGDDSEEIMFTGSASGHFLLLSSNGVVTAWGDNTSGQCGKEACDEADYTDIVFDTDSKIIKVAAGEKYSLALDESGTVWGWGSNDKNRLGIEKTGDIYIPEMCCDEVIDIAAGTDFSAFLTQNGEVYLNGNNQINKQVEFPDDEKIEMIAARGNNFIALSENNALFSWMGESEPELISSFEGGTVLDISAGAEHGVAAVQEGNDVKIYTFGDNSKYQLGTEDSTITQEEAVCVLTVSDAEDKNIVLNTGDYCTFVDVFYTLNSREMIEEYCFGTGCYYIDETFDDYTYYEDGFDEDVIPTPEMRLVSHCVIAVGNDRSVAYRIDDAIEIFGNNEEPEVTPIIAPEEPFETLYEYQYNDIDYHVMNVNFIKLNEEKFEDENEKLDEETETYTEKYSYWEYVNENQFKVKIKDFIFGIGNIHYTPATSIINLSKEATGENRTVGIYGPSVWNFKCGTEFFKTDKTEIEHGSEDGTVLEVSAFTQSLRGNRPLNIPSDIAVYYKDPGEITENTKLGLYVYGLPEGTTAEVSDMAENTFKITLTGNSTADMDDDAVIKLCYIRTAGYENNGEVIGDYDLNEGDVYAEERILNGFLIKNVKIEKTNTSSGRARTGKASIKPSTAETVKKTEIKLKENASDIQYLEVDGNLFKPNEKFARYELLKALNNLFDIENLGYKSEFTDVDGEDAALINLFVGAEIIEGYPDNTFRGEEGITRAEFVKILSIMMNTEESEAEAFSDISGHWGEKYINSFSKLDLVKGYPDGTFKPDRIITKAEAVTVLNRVAKIAQQEVDENIFEDVDEGYWAYLDIYAAVKK